MNNSIQVNCTKKNLKIIRDFVTEYLHALTLTDILMNQIVLAVDEICANLIIHANQEDPSKHILLSIHKLTTNKPGDTLQFAISDWGMAFDHFSYKEPDLQKKIKNNEGGGWGLLLVRRLMDKVEFKTEGSKNTCLLYKKIK
ncbi:ATP-binding protein [Pontibacter toksunensis]|uniref:ATP-binding protein n=1 Tax=Pontibacter toksunensis TaxID=1332631 RepID=A0ABW6BQZ7_9BACT